MARPTKHHMLQSAMEYLMTYGWAILIISVILASLFQLGLFSGLGGPTAQPGSCIVQRVNGPGSVVESLAGECQGLRPRFTGIFNGKSSYVDTGLSRSYSQITVAVWFEMSGNVLSGYPRVLSSTGVCSTVYDGVDITVANNGKPEFEVGNGISCGVAHSPTVLQSGVWYFYTGTYNGSYVNSYIDGTLQNSHAYDAGQIAQSGYNLDIGRESQGRNWYFNGSISNVQIYNTSLSAAEVLALYQEGIGGAPVRPQNITAWWPLNGNANDYSGNNYNGNAYNGVAYTSSWTSGYTQP